MRKSGILLAISSLPSKYGIGTFSKEAYAFVDFLHASGQGLWQILPLGPTGYGDSPYQSFSTYAGNPYYIDLEEFIEKGYLTEEDCKTCERGNVTEVDYENIFFKKFALLRKAYDNSDIEKEEDYQDFVAKNRWWLEDYALYMAIKDANEGKSWIEWEADIKLRKPDALEKCKRELKEEIACYCFQQYFFAKQWKALKEYANEKDIQIIGDIPIYVALDSADTWANPEQFQLKKDGTPKAVAGCPPDAFSATGQLWGNPLYRWKDMKRDEYAWWINRIRHSYELYDIVRIDHFRGFDEYYSIPYGDETAEFGHWEKGPGYALFKTIAKELGSIRIIAEDLGFLTPSVLKLVEKTGYPGMKVLQFAFDSSGESAYLPHKYPRNTVVYTGTHDNDTTVSWYENQSDEDKAFVREYLGLDDIMNMQDACEHSACEDKSTCGEHSSCEGELVCESMIRAALSSVADTAIIPLQDYLKLGGKARMNEPSTLGKNWKWRMEADCLTDELAQEIYRMCKIYGRV